MSNIAIRVENLSKLYRIGARQEGYKTLREQVTNTFNAPFRRVSSVFHQNGHALTLNTQRSAASDVIWALRDVSLEVKEGEVLGIIGRNGAGKSTLLKILSRITEPTEGRVEIHGRVGALLDVGTGFHPELTGRENIYLSGAILGMKKTDIERKFDEIVAFAEVEKFIDTPVKHYSSGMYMRLAFAVAAHLDPDILLLDEVLAVGDFAFQTKCLGKISSLGDSRRTIILVSHNLMAIRSFASRCIWLDAGRVKSDGGATSTIAQYSSEDPSYLYASDVVSLVKHPNRTPNSMPTLADIKITSDNDQLGAFPMGSSLRINVRFVSARSLTHPWLGVAIEDAEGRRIYSTNTKMAGGAIPKRARAGLLSCNLTRIPLNQGIYFLTLQLNEAEYGIDRINKACRFEVLPHDVFETGRMPSLEQGCIYWPSTWECQVTEV